MELKKPALMVSATAALFASLNAYWRTLVPKEEKENLKPPNLQPPPDDLKRVSRHGLSYTVALDSGASFGRDEFRDSPNGLYGVGLGNDGDLILRNNRNGKELWRAGGYGAHRCFLQSDGNLILRRRNKAVTWQSHTSKNRGTQLQLDDEGQLALVFKETALWLTGNPRGTYVEGQYGGKSLTFPIRGIFYYPWFPETWSVNGHPVKYRASLGRYSNGDSQLQRAHVNALNYARVDVAIASWWGAGEQLDRARILNLMDNSIGKGVKWSVYHETERLRDQSVSELRTDLEYLEKWYAWHHSWARIDGRPVIFVYNEGDCDVSRRWMKASKNKWFVILKVFRNYLKCQYQPDHWHQYGPASHVIHVPKFSFSISPGFWRTDREKPTLPRQSMEKWRRDVKEMVKSNETLQLLTTFNEWGEGTAIESAVPWSSSSGYGKYLDILHEIH